MRDLILNFPEQLKAELELNNASAISHLNPENVLFCGMGASGLTGDLVKIVLPQKQIEVYKNYNLPQNLRAKTLVIAVSYSGNTEETISNLNQALKNGHSVAVITGGGELLKLAKEKELPYLKIPASPALPPRLALGYFFQAAIRVLEESNFIGQNETSVPHLQKAEELENIAKNLAPKLANKTVMVYSSYELMGLGLAWKEILNETAKTPAFSNFLPEMNHNEIEGLGHTTNLFILVLKDPQSNERISRRINILGEIAERQSWRHEIIELVGPDRQSQIFNSIMLAYWTSFFIAQSRGLDPIATPLIDEIKNKLK